MKRFVFFYILFIGSVLNAQTWIWAKGPSGDGEASAMAIDQSGNAFISGYFSGPLVADNYTLNSGIANLELYLIKYNSSGSVVWAKQAKGNSQDFATSLALDQQGNSIVCGYFDGSLISFGSTTLTNNALKGVFVAKYDQYGNEVWATSAPTFSNSYAYGVSTDTNNNVYVTGWFEGASIAFGTNTLTNNGAANMFIVKYDPNGNAIWSKNSNSFNCRGTSITTDVNNNTIATGYYSGTVIFGTHTLTSTGSNNMFLVKYDSNGNIIWANTTSGISSSIEPYAITADKTGNIYTAGSFYGNSLSFGTFSINANYGDIFISKHDQLGNLDWVKKASGGLRVYSVSSYSNGVFIAGGMSNTGSPIVINNYTVYPPSGYVDPSFIVQYDLNGNLFHATTLKDGGDDSFLIGVDDQCNGYIHGDFYQHPFTLGSNVIPVTGSGGENLFLARFAFVCDNSGIELNQLKEKTTVYPNPTANKIKIKQPDTADVQLMDLQGKVIGSWIINNEDNEIDITEVDEGFYFVKVTVGNNYVVKKITVLK